MRNSAVCSGSRALNANDFKSQLERVGRAFNKSYTADTLTVMYRRMKDYPLNVFVQACDDLIAEEKFFPKFREIHGAVSKVMSAKGLKIERQHYEGPKYACDTCEDSGIRLRRYRRDLVRDFYCHCETAKKMTKHDWSSAAWASTIEGHTTADRMTALRKASKLLRSPIVDLATGKPIDLMEEATP